MTTETDAKKFNQYSAWKGWGKGTALNDEQARAYELEVNSAELTPSETLLEIGFGNGEFLEWAALHGFRAMGVEILPELVEAASKKGLKVVLANLCEGVPHPLRACSPFAGLVAFDVLEHLTVEAAKHFLQNTGLLAAHSARFVLRFPNGESPFSAIMQNGDYTHQQALTRSKLEQLCVGTGWRVLRYGNAARSLRLSGKGGLFRRLVYPVRNLLELVIGYLYYGRRIPLDPVATAVLVREDD